VPAYFFVGGAAGASAVIASVAQARANGSADAHSLARDARWMAAAGGVLSAALLTSDLGRPERFMNMLRVFKVQSPMSMGAWTLTAFSTTAAAAAFADLFFREHGNRVPVRIVRDAAGVLTAATGLVMSSYTGVLIGATAIPVWNAHVRMLPVHFAASGLASAVAILELRGHESVALNRLGLLAAAAELLTGAVIEGPRNEADEPLKHGESGWITRAGGVLSGPLPLVLRIAGMRSPRARRAAAMTALAGALLTRFGWWSAGSASSAEPKLSLSGTAHSKAPVLGSSSGSFSNVLTPVRQSRSR
jgi:formate-dependent nitrite reductase membrane component NrfD